MVAWRVGIQPMYSGISVVRRNLATLPTDVRSGRLLPPSWFRCTTSDSQLAALVQDVARRLILVHRRCLGLPGHAPDRRYKARSDPRI